MAGEIKKPSGTPVCFEGKKVTDVCGVPQGRCRDPEECLWRKPVGKVKGLGGDDRGTMEGSLPRER